MKQKEKQLIILNWICKMKAYNRELPINWSNKKIYEYINNRVLSKDNVIKKVIDISNMLPYINIQETLDKTIKLLFEKKLLQENTEIIIDFKKKLNRKSFDDHISTKIEAEFYGVYLFQCYLNIFYNVSTGAKLIDLEYKIHQEHLFHNKEIIQDEVIKMENERRINRIEKLPLIEQKKEYLDLINEFEKKQFLNNTDTYSRYINHFKNNIKRINDELKISPQSQINNPEFKFINNFDTESNEVIYKHFKTGLVESKMLTITELEEYLVAAFQNKKKPLSLFCIKNAYSKDKVMKVFYTYYKDVAGKQHGKQKEYAGLLGNYFKGYKTKTVSSNFSKSVY